MQETGSMGNLGGVGQSTNKWAFSTFVQLETSSRMAGQVSPNMETHGRKLEKSCRTISNPHFMGSPVLAKGISTINSQEILRQEWAQGRAEGKAWCYPQHSTCSALPPAALWRLWKYRSNFIWPTQRFEGKRNTALFNVPNCSLCMRRLDRHGSLRSICILCLCELTSF